MGSLTVGGTNGATNGHTAMANLLTAPPKLVAPRNQKAFLTLLVGGYNNARHELGDKLHAEFGLNVVSHWDMEARNYRLLAFPRNIEVVVILSDLAPSGLSSRAIQCAKDQGLPYVTISRRSATWPEKLGALGLESPPLWLRATPAVAEPKPLVVVRTPPAPPAPAPPPVEVKPTPAPALSPPRRVSAFANALRAERERQGFGKAALADLIGCAHGSIANWEAGKDITIAMWLKLVDLMPTLKSTPPPHLARELAAIEAVARMSKPAPTPIEPVKAPAPLPAEPHERVLAISAQAVAGAPLPAPMIPPPPPRAEASAPPADSLAAYMAKLAEAERLKTLAANKRAAAELATHEAEDAERNLAKAIEAAHRMHAEIMERLK